MRLAGTFFAVILLMAGCSNGNVPAGDVEILDAPEDAVDVSEVRDADALDPPRDQDEDTGEDPGFEIQDGGCFHPSDAVYDFSSLGLAPVDPPVDPYVCGECCRQVTFAEFLSWSLGEGDGWGDLLVYTDDGGFRPGNRAVLGLVDLNTFAIYELRSEVIGIGSSVYVATAIYGDKVYASKESLICMSSINPSCCPDGLTECAVFDTTIVRFDLSTGVEEELYPPERIEVSEAGPATGLDAYGDHVVWEQSLSVTYGLGDKKIYTLDPETGEPEQISDNQYCCAMQPSVWGEDLVWDQYYSEAAPARIYAFHRDLVTGETAPIMDVDWDQWQPAVWNGKVVYFDARNGGSGFNYVNPDVFMLDLATGEESGVCDDPAIQFRRVDVHDDVVVCVDMRNDPTPKNP